MRTIYLQVEKHGLIRKVSIDMAYLAKHNLIRLPRYYFEDGLYLLNKKSMADETVEKYFLTKEKVKKEDKDFYYFGFPFRIEQVIDVSI